MMNPDIENAFALTVKAMGAVEQAVQVRRRAGEKGLLVGTVRCPVCTGELHYRHSGGRSWQMKCQGAGCTVEGRG